MPGVLDTSKYPSFQLKLAAASPAAMAAPPSKDVIAAVVNEVFTAETSEDSLNACTKLISIICKPSPSTSWKYLSGAEKDNVLLGSARKAALDKKSGTMRESAMILYGSLYESFPAEGSRVSETLLLPPTIETVLDAMVDKGNVVREAALYAVNALPKALPVEVIASSLLSLLLAYLKRGSSKWQGKVAALNVLTDIVNETAKEGKGLKNADDDELLGDAIGRRFSEIIPVLEAALFETKAQVNTAAKKTLNAMLPLLKNEDITRALPAVVKAVTDPSSKSLHEAIHALSQTTFVAIVASPLLALLTPLLERALNQPQTPQDVLRQTVVVVENLTKLVHDPIEAREFLPKLEPGVAKVEQNASFSEVRSLAKRCGRVIEMAKTGMLHKEPTNKAKATVFKRYSQLDVEALLDDNVSTKIAPGSEEEKVWNTDVRKWLAAAIREAANLRAFSKVSKLAEMYIKDLLIDADQGNAIYNALEQYYTREDLLVNPLERPPSDTETEIVNVDFSLAYGGMLLLNHTNLRLLKGHRYGLVGRNGAGKSTLMRSIANGKLIGFPPKEELRTCFVEHKMQDADADLSIVNFLAQDEEVMEVVYGNLNIKPNTIGGYTDRDVARGLERIRKILSEVGFDTSRQDAKVSSLSGGWRMKTELARAMLLEADVLLLDEPTNHLDVGNVKWLQEYLKRHTEISSLIVSHDSGFLDDVCTDIIHYEADKKLGYYKGNLSEFVKVRPEAKSYYTLSASIVQFKFPAPGILTGIKSQTRAIMKMNNCTFTYPGQSKPSLYNASCQLSLSSRTAIIGGNGAGKSTLIKVLTGEVIPQEGKVEKHPNLRVGYVAQHALAHVELHLEKSPMQYIMWRYRGGDDKEVRMKATRKLSEEDEKQLATPIDLGDGSGPKRIENLVGRQKWKKSFQYEVKWVGLLPKFNTQISRETLLELGFKKLVQEFDDHESAREGLSFRELSPEAIRQHFADCGLDPDIAEHNEIAGLSGGQKVKVVIAAAMWNNPHILVMDEPTNYLDRDSLGGLAVAIRDFKGGVVIISHNDEFVGALVSEKWFVENGRITATTGGRALVADMSRFDSPASVSLAASSAVSSSVATPADSAVNSGAEGGADELKFKAKKKKKMSRNEKKAQEIRRRLRLLEWEQSPKGTPKPRNTDDEASDEEKPPAPAAASPKAAGTPVKGGKK